MQIQVLTDVDGFNLLEKEWDNLLERSIASSLFLTYAWQRTWWEHLGDGDLLLIACRDDGGQLLGIAPLFRQANALGEQQLSLIGCVDVSDYLDLIVDLDHADQVYQAFWSFLSGPQSPDWDEIRLCNIPHDSPTPGRLEDLARAGSFPVTVVEEDVCPVLTLPCSWEEYLASLSKKQRHEIRRKIRRAEELADLRWYVNDGRDDLSGDIETFIELHQKSTTEKEDFWDDAMKSFFRAAAIRLADAGLLKLYFVEFDGVQAATLLCFDYRNEILVYNSGYDPDEFSQLSPGIVLVAYCIQHAIEMGRTRFDFLRGDEVYKFRFGAVSEPVNRLHILRRSA